MGHGSFITVVLRERSLCEYLYTIADELFASFNTVSTKTQDIENCIHRIGEILYGIKERSVKIEQH
jgi:hypothetical protein